MQQEDGDDTLWMNYGRKMRKLIYIYIYIKFLIDKNNIILV